MFLTTSFSPITSIVSFMVFSSRRPSNRSISTRNFTLTKSICTLICSRHKIWLFLTVDSNQWCFRFNCNSVTGRMCNLYSIATFLRWSNMIFFYSFTRANFYYSYATTFTRAQHLPNKGLMVSMCGCLSWINYIFHKAKNQGKRNLISRRVI